jgi:hypothetical protein
MKSKEELEKKLKELEEKRNRWINMDPEDYATARAQLELMEWVLG